MTLSRAFWPGAFVAVAVVAVDQFSKWWIVDVVMQPPRIIDVTSFFRLVMTWNRGVSFGLFATHSWLNAWILPLVTLVIIVALLIWLARIQRLLVGVAIGLIIGGAIGNVIDRARFGAVADFLDFYLGSYHWPAFNVADTMITVGAVVVVADTLLRRTEKR